MKKLVALTCGLSAWLLLAGTSPAQDDECRTVIAKGIKALGSEEKLVALRTAHIKGKGTITVQGMDLEFTAEIFTQQPDKQKLIVDFSVNNMNFTLTRVVDGGKGWQNIMGNTAALDAQELMEAKEAINAERVISLVPLLKDKEYKLSTLGETKVGDHQTVGIQVTRKGYRDVSLYFDKKTYILVKSESRGLDPEKQEVNQEKLYSEYKELVPGLKVAGKMVINNDGKKFMDLTITEVRPVERHDDSLFTKP